MCSMGPCLVRVKLKGNREQLLSQDVYFRRRVDFIVLYKCVCIESSYFDDWVYAMTIRIVRLRSDYPLQLLFFVKFVHPFYIERPGKAC